MMTIAAEQLTVDYIKEILARNDTVGMHAIGRALVRLLDRQTHEEQIIEHTTVNNGIGFTGFDGEIGTSMAKFYKARNFLTAKQLAFWQKPSRKNSKNSTSTNISKYAKQLLEDAIFQQAEKNCKIEAIFEKRIDTLSFNYNNKVLKKLKKWCIKNVGAEGIDWFISSNAYNMVEEKFVTKIWFASNESKVLFSLQWT